MKKMLLSLVLLLAVVSMQAQSWVAPGDGAYSHETVFYAVLEGNVDVSTAEIGAFIGDECRASARVDVAADGVVSNIFTLRVRGDLSLGEEKPGDMGKTVTFKVYDGNTGFEYTLGQTESFDGEAHRIALSLTVPTTFILNFAEAEVGASYELTDYVTVEPTENVTMPDQLYFLVSIDSDPTVWIDPAEYVKLEGTTLKALKPYQGVKLSLMNPNQRELASCYFNIVQYATGITLTATEYEVERSDGWSPALDNFLGSAYTILPPGAIEPEVRWEVHPDDANKNVLEWSERGYFVPRNAGTARIRPYFMKGNNKIVPVIDGAEVWLTVTVVVTLTDISFDQSIFGGSFIVNVGDTHIYDRLKKMITFTPEDATDKNYTIEVGNTDIISLTGATTLEAKAAGYATITVTHTVAAGAAPVTATIRVKVENPPTEVTFGTNQMNVVLEGGRKDITQDVKDNVTLNGDPEMWSENASVTVSGTGVDATAYGFGSTGLQGNFIAYEAGTTTVTINLWWYDYDSWGVTSDDLQKKTVTPAPSFNIVVSEESTLTGFDVAVEEAVAGQWGTITLTPQPEGATFDVNTINVLMQTLAFANNPGWNEQLTYSLKSASASAIVYEFKSTIPDMISVTVSDNAGNIYTLNDPTAAVANSFRYFEIGWPLKLSNGWQWRSNPCGFIPQSDFEKVFTTDNLVEIRTQNDLLYNDSQWGFYGTLNNTVGLKQYECYKLKMKGEESVVLYGSSINSNENSVAMEDANGGLSYTLNPGWNWVGNPYLFNRKLSTVFANANLEVGTVIVGKLASAELDRMGWQGNLTTLDSDQGYLIKNPSAVAKEIILPIETNFAPGNEVASARAEGMRAGSVWSYDHSRFMNNMTIVAVMVGLSQAERFTIGAFVGDECRGEGVINDGLAFITVHCDAGETVTFRLYDTYTGTYGAVTESVKAVTRLGSLKSPFVLHADLSAQGIDDITASSAATIGAYDLSGRSVNSSKRGVSIRRTADGTYRKVVVK